jgi:hypothetical protein
MYIQRFILMVAIILLVTTVVPKALADQGTVADILVVYTPAARDAAGGVTNIEATITQAISNANSSFTNSRVPLKLNLVHRRLVTYTESTGMSTDLSRLQNPSDGHLDDVPRLKDLYRADFAILLTNTGSGQAFDILSDHRNQDFGTKSYAVLNQSLAATNLTLAHEVGHLMGLNHAREDPTGTGCFPYSFGYKDPSKQWRTVMAYQISGSSAPRIQFFSNPRINSPINNNPLGVVDQADNARSLDNTFLTLVNMTNRSRVYKTDSIWFDQSSIYLTGVNGWQTIPVASGKNFGEFNVVNGQNATFASIASNAHAKIIYGDFNGDGYKDLAAIGVREATTIPVAIFQKDTKTFKYFSSPLNQERWGVWAAMPEAKVVPGDFNYDGATDLALVGVSTWNSIPVAYSNKNGSFNIANFEFVGSEFLRRATDPNVRILVGNFDGDSFNDIILTGGTGWTGLTKAKGKSFGFDLQTINIPTTPVNSVERWMSIREAQVIIGDFDNSGTDDFAITGVPGWGTIPVVFANLDGSFKVTNNAVPSFPAWAANGSAKILAGDFDGNRKMDLALTGVTGWGTIPIAFSKGDGDFTVTNKTVSIIPSLTAKSNSEVVVGNFDGDNFDDFCVISVGGTTMPVAHSQGDGTFNVTNVTVSSFPSWSSLSQIKSTIKY